MDEMASDKMQQRNVVSAVLANECHIGIVHRTIDANGIA